MRRYKQDHRNPRRLRYGWRLSESGHILIDPLQRECIFLILHLRWHKDTRYYHAQLHQDLGIFTYPLDLSE